MKGDPKAKAAAAPAVKKDPVAESLARIEREIARVQKKLGMDFTWYKG